MQKLYPISFNVAVEHRNNKNVFNTHFMSSGKIDFCQEYRSALSTQMIGWTQMSLQNAHQNIFCDLHFLLCF